MLAIKPLTWAVGVTTVPSRFDTYLPQTLASLGRAGWDRDLRLFIDGGDWHHLKAYQERWPGLQVTARDPALPGRPGRANAGNIPGNWTLALWELWIRNPKAHRYMVVQDDVLFLRNTRAYLETVPWPDPQCYLNLYCDQWNDRVIEGKAQVSYDGRQVQVYGQQGHKTGFHRGHVLTGPAPDLAMSDLRPVGHHYGYQMGRGALALVFDRAAVIAMLASHNTVMKPQDPVNGWRRVDGMIVTSMNEAGFSEYVHNPSLVGHIGQVSSMGNAMHPGARTFKENGDALELLPL